jgi:hypothetical protein
MKQGVDHNPESENNSLPNQREACHYHSQAQSDLHGDPLNDMRVEIASIHHEICQVSLPHSNIKSSRVKAGTRHN